ncbi:MAG: dipicolinate synthase subunit B [Clostridiales bacterium]|jgi:dipicolinate synthase subunit B|nr:dipicolinate synthase subunit B [Clostridiales bacterium]
MTVNGKNIGFALTGSYCTFDQIFPEIEKLITEKANVTTIFSYQSATTNSRFGDAKDFLKKAEKITSSKPITTIVDAEPLGPNNMLDVIVIAPCTGNTLAKLANGITDSPVLMAAKGHLRNNKPVVIAISTNDALSANLKNIGILLNAKNCYFVPFSQDNYKNKPNSMVAHFELILPTIEAALDGRQIQPVIRCK